MNFTSHFLCTHIFEREHLAVWLSGRVEFFNSINLTKEYMEKIQYNNKFVLKKVVGDKLYLYSLTTKEFYIFPKEFLEIINSFDGDVQKLLKMPQMALYNNKEDIISFLLEKLYV